MSDERTEVLVKLNKYSENGDYVWVAPLSSTPHCDTGMEVPAKDVLSYQPKGDTEAERACVKIYMTIAVSSLADVYPPSVRDAWLIGQGIYNSLKLSGE